MTVGKEERLSALVDDEVTGFETRRLCDELARDPEARETWSRQHLIGAAIRGELAGGYRRGFAEAVMRAIEVEETIVAPRRRVGRVTGYAVAASVAVVGFLAVQMVAQQGGDIVPETVVVTPIERAPQASATTQLAADDRPVAADAQIDAYLLNHAEYAARPGMVSFARVVSYESDAR